MFSKVRSDHMALLGPMWCASNLDVATAISFQKQWRQIILSSLYQPLLDNDECCCYRMSSCLLRWAPLPPNGIDSIAPNSPLPPLLSLSFYHHQRLLRSSEQSWWQHHGRWSSSTVAAAAAAVVITIIMAAVKNNNPWNGEEEEDDDDCCCCRMFSCLLRWAPLQAEWNRLYSSKSAAASVVVISTTKDRFADRFACRNRADGNTIEDGRRPLL